MALNKNTLTGDLKDAFKWPLGDMWSTCILHIATKIDAYIKTAAVRTDVTGTVTPPSGPPVQAVGVGTGTVTTNASLVTAMQNTLEPLFTNPATVWAQIPSAMVTPIDNMVKGATVNTSVTGGLTGAGVGAPGTINTVPGLALLSSQLAIAWTTPGYNYDDVATKIADAVDNFLKSCVVNTVDSGVIPPNSWAGVGLGILS